MKNVAHLSKLNMVDEKEVAAKVCSLFLAGKTSDQKKALARGVETALVQTFCDALAVLI